MKTAPTVSEIQMLHSLLNRGVNALCKVEQLPLVCHCRQGIQVYVKLSSTFHASSTSFNFSASEFADTAD